MYLGERCWRQNHCTFAVPIRLHTVIGDIGNIQAERLKKEGLVDATEIVQVVKDYDIYLQYWTMVTNSKDYVTHPIWEAQTYGYVGDLYTVPIEQPVEHVHIPPPHLLSHVSVLSTFYCTFDFCWYICTYIFYFFFTA